MHILFLSRWLPLPATNGSKIRISNLIRGLAAHHNITLITFYEAGEDPQQPQLDALCDDVYAFKWKPFDPQSAQQQRALFSMTPRSIVQNFSAEFANCIQSVLQSQKIDVIIASQLAAASYATYFGRTPALFEEVELSLYSEKAAKTKHPIKKLRRALMWTKHKSYMRSLTAKFACSTVASSRERDKLKRIAANSHQIAVIPNMLDSKNYAPATTASHTTSTLIFPGAFTYHVNHEAMIWFLQNAYAQIQMQHPDVTVRITGDHANLPLPSATNVIRTGYVDDIHSEIAAATIAIVPLRHGGGTRLKILEAMLLGTAVVSTSKGAEGLECTHGKHLLIADSPTQFASAVNQLLADDALRARLIANARSLVLQKYDCSTVLPQFLDLVETVGSATLFATNASTKVTPFTVNSH